MQRCKEEIRKEIVRQALKVFRSRGFAKSSMSQIAEASGVCLSTIYNHFSGREALFREVVHPAVLFFERLLEGLRGRHGTDILEILSEFFFRQVVEEYVVLLRNYRKELQILLFRAQGSSLEHFREKFTDRSAALVRTSFDEVKRRHPQTVADVSDFFIRLHSVWMFSLLEELLTHPAPPEETERSITEYNAFEVAGWRELMRLGALSM